MDDDILERAKQPAIIGDRAGEYRALRSGDYDAWMYVIIAFVFETLAIGWLPGLGAREVAAMMSDDPEVLQYTFWIGGGVIGAAIAYLVFHDRWRCIEAVTSRYCSGLVKISLLYVPLIAFFYANWRGFQKLRTS